MNTNPLNPNKTTGVQPQQERLVRKGVGSSGDGPDFKSLLDKALRPGESLKFSRHVQSRIDQRGIAIDSTRMQSLQHAVGLAAEKGIRDSLVVVQDAAFIVNIPSKTVVTALDQVDLKQRVFTNIDGAVFY